MSALADDGRAIVIMIPGVYGVSSDVAVNRGKMQEALRLRCVRISPSVPWQWVWRPQFFHPEMI
jgi:hypothetical protein